MRRTLTPVFRCLLAAGVLLVGEAAADSIGINFNSNRDAAVAEIGPSESAGVPAVAQVNWNNTNGGSSATDGASGSTGDILSPSAGVLVDDSGSPVAVTVSWSSNGTWNTNNGGSNGNAKLMNGYIDAINAGGLARVDLAGIPYAQYDVYVYFGSDGNGRTGSVFSPTAGQEFFFTTFSNRGGFDVGNYVLTEANAGNPEANYCVFRDQTSGTFSVQLNRGSSNSGFHGIQIVGTAVAGAPAVVTNPATLVSSDSARLNGMVTDVGSGAPAVTMYYGDNDGLTNAESWDSAVSLQGEQAGAFFADVADLLPGQTYYFRSYASNASGSGWSAVSESFQTEVSPPAVVNLPPSEIMTGSARVGAEVTATGGGIPLVTIFYGRNDGGSSEANWGNSVQLGAQEESAQTVLTGLQAGVTYFYRARATNEGGISWAPVSESLITERPAFPVVVNRNADSVRGASANLRGEVTDTGFDAPSITFYYGRSDGGSDPESWEQSVSIGERTGRFSLFVSDLDPFTTYYFRSRASNVAGSAWAPSSESFTTTDLLSSSLVINEIHYDHEPKTERGEFLEIFNPGDSPVLLTGWQLNGAIDFDFPEGTSIEANGFLVVAEDPGAMRAIFGLDSALGPYSGRLSNDGERIELEDENGSLIDEVSYGIGFPWPTASRGGGSSMELINEDLDNQLGSSWRSSGSVISGGPQVTYVPAGDSWRYRRGTSEASDPPEAWRMQDFFEDETWATGQAGFGYGDGDDATVLNDMRGSYSSVFLRKDFNVTGEIPTQLSIRIYHDDGAIVWINGDEVARVSVDQGDLTHRGIRSSDPQGGSDGSAVNNHEAEWTEVLYSGARNTLRTGTNTVTVQGFNGTLSSSDFSIDCELRTPPPGNPAVGVPTPGGANTVYASNAPPNIRQVEHSPSQPATAEEVLVTAKVSDPDGVRSVTLTYQLVEPGAYVHKEDSAYEDGWVPLEMVDDGTGGDVAAGDSIFSVAIPSTVQVHRRLVRYRITVEDELGTSQRTPFEDDESPNFAYFCYDGVPDWSGSKRPGVLRNENYPSEALESIAVYHLITKESDVIRCQWTGPTDGQYRYLGTWVYEGKVYDHMRYRIRGRASTRQVGKNKWKFNFNRARPFEARDNYGRKYDVSWDKINGLPATNPWWRNNASTDGTLFCESLGFRLYQLAGGLASNTHFYHFRIIDDEEEAPSDQYGGDFWGLYTAIEQPDMKFLEARNMPEGNLYNAHGGSGSTKRAQASTLPADKSDLFAFQSLHSSGTSRARWEDTLEFDDYFAFNAINLAINNSDMRPQENINYYHNSETGKWHILPWDLDLTFEDAPHLGRGDTSDWERIYHCLQYPDINQAYQNRVREILDLLLDNDQSSHAVDEFAGFLTRGGRNNIVEAGQAVWDYHPRKSKKGIWYANFNSSLLTSRTFAGLTEYTRDFLTLGGYGRSNLAAKSADSAIPNKPVITYVGPSGFRSDELVFRSSSFNDPQGRGTFGSMEWRLGEVLNPDSPNYVEGDRYVYEIETFYQSPRLVTFERDFTFPATTARPGRTYRARVRHLDSSGRASNWSDPVEFTAATPLLSPWTENLMVTEIHYNPLRASASEIAAGFVTSDFEFIEIYNRDPSETLNLRDIRFTKGIDFDFRDSSVTSLGPHEFALVVRNTEAFTSRYGEGLPVAGSYGPDNLSNGGENVKLSFGAGSAIREFQYSDEDPWPSGADGSGFSLVLVTPDSSPDHADPASWTTSVNVGGSPGAAEPVATFAGWKNDIFTTGELNDPDISGDSVDLDSDGMSNLLEYALVSDPRAPDPGNLPDLIMVPDGSVLHPALRYRRRPGSGDLAYTIESSRDLINWVPQENTVLVDSSTNDDGSVTDTVRVDSSTQALERFFLRLRVEVQ